MKKGIILSFFILFSVGTCIAQSGLGWKFSVNFDPLVTWGRSSNAIESEGSRMGFNFSVIGENYFKERYAFYVGGSYMNMGGKIKNISQENLYFKNNDFTLSPNESANIRLQYLTIPFGIKFKTPNYGMMSYYFQSGLFTGFRLGGSVSTRSVSRTGIASSFNFMTAGLNLGAGAMYATGDDTYLRFGISFIYSFTDVLRQQDTDFKPIGLGLHLGFLF